MLRTFLRTPWWPIVLVAFVLIAGGPLNSVDARGVIVADANGLPLAPRDVFFGARHYKVGEDGVYFIPNLPRGAKFSVIAQGYNRADVPAGTTEVRLVTAIITLNVADSATGQPVKNPEARVGSRVVGRGTDSGIMVIAPAPPKTETILVCASGYASGTMQTGLPTAGIRLAASTDEDSGCPELPGASPRPSAPVITPNPAPASPAATPTSSPR
ncbi:MAG: hypothetical protein FJ034_00525 [Chloroflexi bacterium]|nr:hypothetical protein [Chloroflexota bacterium]